MSVFDFLEFARGVYSDPRRPAVGEAKYVLPAFYGGLSDGVGKEYEALVVLESPSKKFTKDRWNSPCNNLEDAIKRHREIFFQWAFDRSTGQQAEVFEVLVGRPSTAKEFFRRLYITDVWKDWEFKEKLKRSSPRYLAYGRYWRSKLEVEIKSVAAKRVVFIGDHACRSGFRHVPHGTPTHCLAFPSWSNSKALRTELRQLEASIRGETGRNNKPE